MVLWESGRVKMCESGGLGDFESGRVRECEGGRLEE